MAIKHYLKPTEEFVKENFYDRLIQKGFVPFKKSCLQWAKFVHDDVLALICFNVETLGDFDLFYGATTTVQNLPFGLTPHNTYVRYTNEMLWANKELPKYKAPLSQPRTYGIKLQSISEQLEKIVFPAFDKEITPKDVVSLSRYIPYISCYEYLYGDFEKFENKIKEIANDEDRKRRILEEYRNLEFIERRCPWSEMVIYNSVLAYINQDYSILEKHIQRCKEFNLKLLKKNIPMLFE